MTPRVVFGMTLYNNARHLPAALESLLAQSDPDFGLVMVDDASVDDTEAVARSYAARDPRLRYRRHASRQGMVPTWRDAFAAARAEFPSAEFFAWASDHDWWHPDWLRRVRSAIEAGPGNVLAYALTQRVDEELQPLDKPPKAFDTTDMAGPFARVMAFAAAPVGAGDMVYGLMRVSALERAGVFRSVIQPDRLLMVELAMAGRFAQVPEVLWLRRQPAQASVEKQKTTLFAGEMPPALGRPVWVQHTDVLLREYVSGGAVARPASRPALVWLILRYQLVYLFRHHAKQGYLLHRADKAVEAVQNGWKAVRLEARWIWYRTRMRLRPKHVARVVEKHALHLFRRAVYQAAVARRRARAASYETGQALAKQSARLRRLAKRARYQLAMLTHRLGLRG